MYERNLNLVVDLRSIMYFSRRNGCYKVSDLFMKGFLTAFCCLSILVSSDWCFSSDDSSFAEGASEEGGSSKRKLKHVASGKTPDGLSDKDWNSIREAYEKTKYSVRPVKGDKWLAVNHANQWKITFGKNGFITGPLAGDQRLTWRWGLELESFGREGSESRVRENPTVEYGEGKIVFNRGSIYEWFVNDQNGLEHGFTVPDRPRGSDLSDRLCLSMAVKGNLKPRTSQDGQE